MIGPANLPTDYLVIVGFGAVWAALLTLGAIQEQTQAANQNTNISKRNIELIIRKEAAVIEVRPPDSLQDIEFNGVFPIAYTVSFHCPVGVYIARTSAWALCLASPWIKEREVPLSIIEIPKFVTPEMKEIPCKTSLSVVRPDQVRKLEQMIHFYGFVEYRNVHMEDREPNLLVQFHYVWIPNHETLGTPQGGYWTPYESYKSWEEADQRRNRTNYGN